MPQSNSPRFASRHWFNLNGNKHYENGNVSCCYDYAFSQLDAGNHRRRGDHLTLGPNINVTEGTTKFADFMLNRSLFADAFRTKNARKGLRDGISMNLSQDVRLVKAGAISLRAAFEGRGWPFATLVGLGLSEERAWLYSQSYGLSEGVEGGYAIVPLTRVPRNHLIFGPHNHYLDLTVEGNQPEPSAKTLSDYWSGYVGRKNLYRKVQRTDLPIRFNNGPELIQFIKENM